MNESETRARRRIREAVEARGYTLTRLTWEPWGAAAEKSGISGGWECQVSPRPIENFYGSEDFCGLSVEELLQYLDQFLPPREPCECPKQDRSPTLEPFTPIFFHTEACPYRIRYWLRWWGAAA